MIFCRFTSPHRRKSIMPSGMGPTVEEPGNAGEAVSLMSEPRSR